MGTIVCATRGGEASIKTQEYAINLAKERGVKLIFVYVTDVHFLDHTGASILVDVATEIENMGEFLLLMAKERAEKAGISADIVTKRGVFRDALVEVVQETNAELVVLGKPDDRVLPMQTHLDGVVLAIKEQTGVDAIIAKVE